MDPFLSLVPPGHPAEPEEIIVKLMTSLGPEIVRALQKDLDDDKKVELATEIINKGLDTLNQQLNLRTRMGEVTWDDAMFELVKGVVPEVVKSSVRLYNKRRRCQWWKCSCYECCKKK